MDLSQTVRRAAVLFVFTAGVAACSGAGNPIATAPPGGGSSLSAAASASDPASADARSRRGASPSPSTQPTSSPSPAATAAATAGSTGVAVSVSASNYVNISNTQEWPVNYRPYCANSTPNAAAPCPFNVVLPASPAHLMTQNGGSATILAAMAAHGHLGVGLLNNTLSLSQHFPVYLAKSSDPAVTVSCNGYCWNGSAETSSYAVTINIPSYARAGVTCPGDCGMAIIQPNGSEYSIYGMSGQYGGGTSISSGGIDETNIVTGNGVEHCYASLTYPGNGGGCVNNGSLYSAENGLRIAELNNGIVPHALVVTTNYCTSGQVYPGSTGEDCAANYGYTGAPIGARFIVNLTDAQINGTASNSLGYNAANTAAWERVLLHAFRDYGIILGPTCGGYCGSGNLLLETNDTQIVSAGGTPPIASFNFSSPASGSGGIGTFPSNWKPGGLSLTSAAAWQIVDPCYSLERADLCSDVVN